MEVNNCFMIVWVILMSFHGNLGQNLTCKNDEFKCPDGSKCLHRWRFCNGLGDCSDNSDENRRNYSAVYDRNTVFCKSAMGLICVLPPNALPINDLNCKNLTCNDDEFECLDGSGCLRSSRICDGRRDCRDNSDENRRNNSVVYQRNVTFCRSHRGNMCILPSSTPSIRGFDCHENLTCRVNEFECQDGSQCLSSLRYCNGRSDCRDGSDENKISRYRKEAMCGLRDQLNSDVVFCALPEKYICDGPRHCHNGIDECLCDYTSAKSVYFNDQCFRCLSSTARIPQRKVCDGVVDCHDFSDECICNSNRRLGVCSELQFQPDRKVMMTCKSGQDGLKNVQLESICDGRNDCDDMKDEMLCKITRGIKQTDTNNATAFTCANGQAATKCDAVPECDNLLEEECTECFPPPEFCKAVKQEINDAGNYKLSCQNSRGASPELKVSQICDGRSDCRYSLEEYGCGNRYNCTSQVVPSLEISRKCNRVDDCADGRDEKNCPHFYCNDTGNVKYLDRKQHVCDGIQHCLNGSDECQDGCVDSAFSNNDSMITSLAAQVIFWIIGLGALIGCSSVIVLNLWNWKTKRNIRNICVQKQSEINKILLLSLSVSDAFVGMYVVAICVKSVQFREKYCLVDREWRSSVTCSGIGAMLIIGSEQSVLTMVLMTTHRFYSTLRPMNVPKLKFVWISLIISWIISILIGTIPTLQSAEDYFVDEVTFRNCPLYSSVSRSDVEYLNNWLSLMHNETILKDYNKLTNWNKLKTLVSDLNPNYTLAYKFGYYSTHTVCLPTLFPDRNKDYAWGYTLFLLLLNFFCFIYMMIGYLYLYRNVIVSKSNSATKEKSRIEGNRNMQIKLTIIVLTDFFCWMPVCIMGFIQLFGYNIPKDAYLPTGFFIIPINSALNPFIYSRLPDVIWNRTEPARKRLRNLFMRMRELLRRNDSVDTHEMIDVMEGGSTQLEEARDKSDQ